MTRTIRVPIAARILLAFLVFLGMSGSGLASARCATGLCGDNCAMHAQSSKPPSEATSAPLEIQPEHSCCPEKLKDPPPAQEPSSPKESDKNCECGISGPTDVMPLTAKMLDVSAVIVLALAPESTVFYESKPPANWQPILLSSDSSPPSVFHHPDLGRAPPVA